MNIFALEKFDDSGKICSFYTVRWDGEILSETDKFFEKHKKDDNLRRPIQELAYFISKKIGDEVGALEAFFKFENTAQALPPTGNYKVGTITINFGRFPLRIFCLRLSNNLVVLFNGGEKTNANAQGGKTSMVFYEANQFAKRILNALQKEEIYITLDGRGFIDADNNKEIIL